MKAFSVFGVTQSGKTTTIENIIKELRKRRYTVGSIKEIHYEKFTIDREGTNTHRHKMAGSQLVAARGNNETDILFPAKLGISEIIKFYNHDFLVMEGVTDANVPKIITAHSIEEINERLDKSVFAISGRIADKLTEYKGIPVINSITNINNLVNVIEQKVFEILPDFPSECCNECGYSCKELTGRIINGKAHRKDCKINEKSVKLFIDEQRIDVVPFVEKILKNTVLGIVQELEGYKAGKTIEIKIGDK